MSIDPYAEPPRFKSIHNERDCVSHSSNCPECFEMLNVLRPCPLGTGGRRVDRDARAHLYLQGWSAESKPRAGDFGALRTAAERALRQALPVLLSPRELLALVEMAEGDIRG